jgi:heptosyltransferase-2
MKTLIIGPSWVGDMVMSQGLYRQLKQQDPTGHIDVMAPDWCRPILSRMPEVDSVLAMPLGHGALAIRERRTLGKQLQHHDYDQAIVLPGSFKSALVPWFAKIPKRTGWLGEMRYGLLNDHRKLDKLAFPLMIERYIALAIHNPKNAKCLPSPLPYPKLRVDLEKAKQLQNQFQLNDNRPIAIFCPGAEFGPAKRWPHYHYAELANQLIQQNWQIWVLGSKKDQPIGEDIANLLVDDAQSHYHNLAGKTQLEDAVDLMAIAKIVITNDSGLMHIAAAVNTPLIALYGPTSPQFTPPLSDKAKVLRLIDGFIKIRKGDQDQGYHQSLIDIQPSQVLKTMAEMI